MNSIFLSIAVVAAVTVFLLRWVVLARRRNAQSWDSLVRRLQPDWNARELTECATPEERWQQVQGARGLCAMYHNARVMMEMTDYAVRNSVVINQEVLAALRSDALQIRILVIRALTQYALHQVNEGIGVNAVRAASMYKEMSARMSDLLQGSAGGPLPQFVGAM